jgi:hypothetical protein
MLATRNPIEILKSRPGVAARFGTALDNSLEEERKEVLEGVLQALAEPGWDADRLAVCAGLLGGLIGRPAAQGLCSSVSKSNESRGATPVSPPNRMAL